MKRQLGLTTALAAGALLLGAFAPAHAITINTVTQNLAYVPVGGSYQAPVVAVGLVEDAVGSLLTPPTHRSPWENPDGTPINPQFSNQHYTSVFTGSALYNFVGNTLDIFWGSPDTYNSITFFEGSGGTGNFVTYLGSQLLFPTLGNGHDQVRITTIGAFQSVRIESGNPAFEFTNLSTCGGDVTGTHECGAIPGTPLPAALPLFASAFAGVGGLLGWRKRRKAKSAALVPAAA